MPIIQERVTAYLALVGFCLLSSIRDVVSEVFFKDRVYGASPVFVLFVYSLVTQVIAALLFLAPSVSRSVKTIPFRKIRGDLFWLNFFTFVAFALYFFAIDSPIGASVNSFVDYGSGPIFTAVVAVFLAGERLNKIFAWSAAVSLIGIVILAMPRLQAGGVSLLWLFGLAIALLSSLSGAFYRVYFKILLQMGLAKSAVVFLRLIATTLVLGVVLLLRPDLFRADILVETVVIGILGFALPLFLVLTILQRVTISHYAMLLFLVPAMTYAFSAALGYGHFFVSDIVAAVLIFAGVGLYEIRSGNVKSGARTPR